METMDAQKITSKPLRSLKLLFSGLVISLLGTLPLGTLNITAFSIAASKSLGQALWFAIAVVLIESMAVRLTLLGDKRINFNGKLSLYLIPAAVLLLLYLSISSFMAVGSTSEVSTGDQLFPAIQSTFLLGVLLSVLNPLQIPFWMGWNRVLISRNTLSHNLTAYILYITGIGVGTLSGLLVFIFAGKYLLSNYQQYSSIVSFILGVLYLGFSLHLLFLLYKKHFRK